MSKNIVDNSHHHPTFLEQQYQNIIEMIDYWTFDTENEEKGNSRNYNTCGSTN